MAPSLQDAQDAPTLTMNDLPKKGVVTNIPLHGGWNADDFLLCHYYHFTRTKIWKRGEDSD